jgi:hypothetical protein
MSFKIKDSLQIGTVTVFNAAGQLVTPAVKDANSAYTSSLIPTTLSADRTLTMPDLSGTIALTSQLGSTVNDGTLGAASSTAGATNTTVETAFSASWSANSASNVTIKNVVGPAISALATLMTGVTTGFVKKTAADTYSLDTSTYLTSSTGVASISFGTTGLTPNTATSGTVTVGGTLALANGGSGQVSAQLAMNAFAAAVTSGSYLRGNGTNVVMSTIQAADVPTLNQDTSGTAAKATNLAGGAAGSLPYQSGADTTAFLAAGTTSQVLVGSPTAPTWSNTPTLTGTNFTSIPNSALSNSTISGVALGSNLASLTAGVGLVWSTGTTYNGSAAATLAVDTTTTGTPSVWASLTTGTLSIAAGLTTGIVNIAASGTSVNTVNIGNTNTETVVNGNLTVKGTTTTLDTQTIKVLDKNIEMGNVAVPTNITADGGGITLLGTTDKTIIWDLANANWTSSEDWNVPTGKGFKINNVAVLSGTTLGSTIVTSSLTSVGTITSGTWSGSFGAVSGANLTSLTAGNLSGTIPSAVLGNSNVNIGTTSVALNRASANLALTGILSVAFAGATSGSTTLVPTAIAGSTTITMPAATGTMALTSDLPTVNSGTLGATTSTAGATNTGVEVTFSGSWDANSASNVTIKNTVGPAITALASAMTGAGAGFLKKTAADTYSIDTSTYLTAEADTLASVTGRGTTTAVALTFTNTTDSTDLSSGSMQFSGGVAIAKNLTIGGATLESLSAGAVIANKDVVQATVATVSATAVDSWAVATYRSCKYLVQITQGTDYQVSEIMVIHNGTTTTKTEYAVLETNGVLGDFTADISGGNARLIVTMAAATSATINISKTMLVV